MPNQTNDTNENRNPRLDCQRNCTTVNEILAVMESGDMIDCNGCSNFVYRGGICGCRHTSK